MNNIKYYMIFATAKKDDNELEIIHVKEYIPIRIK